MQKNLADKIKAEYAMYAEDESSLQEHQQGAAAAAAGGSPQAQQQAKKQRPIDVQVACMSRAGREPGYKKTNQDNCFAFEKYITEEQSMFGAMDGHGPHGEPVLPRLLQLFTACQQASKQETVFALGAQRPRWQVGAAWCAIRAVLDNLHASCAHVNLLQAASHTALISSLYLLSCRPPGERLCEAAPAHPAGAAPDQRRGAQGGAELRLPGGGRGAGRQQRGLRVQRQHLLAGTPQGAWARVRGTGKPVLWASSACRNAWCRSMPSCSTARKHVILLYQQQRCCRFS